MDIGNVSPPVGGGYLGGSQGGYQPVLNTASSTSQQPTPQSALVQQAPTPAEKAHYEEVQKASQAIQSNYFVVSDVSFTIFKDMTGDYVTRYTSLKDGSVKYYPQKDLFEQVQILKERGKTVFETEA